MRNFNTSYVKNAISFFANDASNVLRETSGPAASLLRLIWSITRNCVSMPLPQICRQPVVQYQQSETTAGHQAVAILGRSKSATSLTSYLFGERCDGLRDDLWSLDKA